jgi:hypothetical protein
MAENLESYLPDEDIEFLKRKNFKYNLRLEQPQPDTKNLFLVIDEYSLPDVYNPALVTLLIRFPANYPDAAPDMFYTQQVVKLRASGSDPEACGGRVIFLNLEWQQWSRHFDPKAWRSMIDGLETYMGSIRTELARKR